MGPAGKVGGILNFDPSGDFSLSARPLACLRLSTIGFLRRLHYLLSSGTPHSTIFDDLSQSYDPMSETSPKDDTWMMMIGCTQTTPVSQPTAGE